MQAALAAVPDAAVSPFDRTAALRAGLWPVCGHWPSPAKPPPAEPPLPHVPFLILSGELDLRTPLEGARRLAAHLPNARLVREPGWGHDTLSAGPDGCAAPATRRFLRGQPIDGCGRLKVTPAQRWRPRRACALEPAAAMSPEGARRLLAWHESSRTCRCRWTASSRTPTTAATTSSAGTETGRSSSPTTPGVRRI
jgi:hypothetical protein